MLTVSEGIVAANDRSSREVTDEFAERIELGRDFKARRGRACSWHDVPKGYAAADHVNIVDLRFGNRLELLAFIVDEDNTVSLAARAQALYQDRPWFPSTLSPGDSQWPDNAPGDLVARFADTVNRPTPRAGVYQLVVQAWERDLVIADEDTFAGEGASPREAGLPRILPLAAVAMYAEGFRACIGPEAATITLNIRMDAVDCDIHAVLSQGDETVYEIRRYGITYEGLYDGLRILFLNLIDWRESVVDSFRHGNGFEPLQTIEVDDPDGLLETRKTILIGKEKEGFVAVEVATGKRLWSVPFDEKGGSGASWDGQMFLRKKTRFTSVSTGGERGFSVVAENPDQMSIRGELCADRRYHELRFLDKGEQKWTKVLPWTIQAGPLLTDDGVVLGDAKGEFRCFSLQGDELWTVALPKPVRGAIYENGGLFFAVDDGGVMVVIDPRGTLVWQADIGDVMTGPPEVIGNAVVVGSKSGRLFSFDRKTGRSLRKREFNTWLLSCRLVAGHILCITRDRRLHVLDAASFEQVQALRFPLELNPHILPVRDFQRRRAGDAIDGRAKITGYLVSDVKGHVFVLPLGSTSGKPR